MDDTGMNLKGSEHKWASKPCQRTEKLHETHSFASHDEILEELNRGNSSKEKQELHSEKELKMGSSVPKEAQARTPGVPFLGKNVSLSTFLQSALKTSISEVLRKNIDAADREKEMSRSSEKAQSSEKNTSKLSGRGETQLSASSTKIRPDILYSAPHIVMKSRQSRVRPKIGMNVEEIEIIPEVKVKTEPSFQEGDHDSYVTSSPPRACALKSFPSHATKTFPSHATKSFSCHATKTFPSHATKTLPSHATKTFHSHATKTFPSHATKSLTSVTGVSSKQANNIVIVKTEPDVSQPENPVTADLTPLILNERCQIPNVVPYIRSTTLSEVDKSDEVLETGTVPPVQMKPIKSEENLNFNSLTNVSNRSKKTKKRHFKGATYGLYLTPKRKRKSKKASDSNSKDDEISLASTENGSCIDSDGSSLFSDFTPSEKSLADDEVCSSSRCSPILLPTEHQIELSTFKESPLSNETRNYSQPSSAHVENNDKQSVSFSKLSDSLQDSEDATNLVHIQLMRCATSKKDQSEKHDIEHVSIENHSEKERKSVRKSAHTKTATVFSPNSCRNTNAFDPEQSLLSNSNADADSGHGSNGTATSFSHHSSKLTNTVDSNDSLLLSNNTGDSAAKHTIVIKTEPGLEESPVTVPSSFAFLSDDMQEYYNANENMGDSSTNANSSTIARSVKSRQRTKRRFTDDIVDTEIGLLSLNSLPCKKIKVENQVQKTVHISDVIGSLSEFTESLSRTPKTGPIIKAEFIYNPKLPPIGKCRCLDEPVKIKFGKDRVNVFCQAVDSYDDKRIGCCNPVRYCHLVRPSTRIPFTVMCDMHLWRLKLHHCCPHCGLFCSQGMFLACSSFIGKDEHKHVFHKNCLPLSDRNDPYCLHCGNGLKIRTIHLSVHLPRSPTQLLFGEFCKMNPSAKMSTPSQGEQSERNCFKVVSPGKSKVTFSTSGLFAGNDMSKFEAMLKKLASTHKDDIPDYPANDLYTAAREGCTLKVLSMLYRGASPNRKFLEYNRETALHAVATTKNVIIAHVLIQAGALIDDINDSLQTPLMIATENNQVEMATYLIHRKATTDTRGESGMTCLHLAAKEGNLEMCGALLTNPQIKLDVQDDGGWTPIVWASEHGHAGIVRLLLQKGADPNIRDKEGNTALHWAAFSGNSRICDACVAHGCIVNEVNVHGDTPLHIAARQDNGSCVEFLLNNGASVDCRNKAQQLPIDCCGKETASSKYIRLHSMMVQLFKKDPEQVTRIVTTDMALGREKIPIACVNWIDDVDLVAKDFLYVTENCQTGPVKMDRSIATLQSCECHGDCVSLSCTCSNISFKCWYDRDGRLVPEFNMIDPPMLFECNRACLCDVVNCRNRVVQKGISCRLQLVRTNGKGWGVRTLKDIPKGTFICEYVGEIITDSEADKRQDDSYLFDLDNRDGETYCLDARRYGNISRFINHLCEPNLVPIKVFVNHQDLSFPRIAFFSARDIKAYEELGFDYGEKFWVIKSKWFTCSCGSPGCKYSAETIHETLSHYTQRSEEQVED